MFQSDDEVEYGPLLPEVNYAQLRYTVRLKREKTGSFVEVIARGISRNDAMKNAEKNMCGWYAVNSDPV